MTMATEIEGKKISELTERTELTGNEMIPFAEGGANGKVKLDTLKAAVQPDLSGKQVQLVTSMEDIPEEIMPIIDIAITNCILEQQNTAITAEQFQTAKQYLQGENNVYMLALSVLDGGNVITGFVNLFYLTTDDVIYCMLSIPNQPNLYMLTCNATMAITNTGEAQIIYCLKNYVVASNDGISILSNSSGVDGTTYSKSILLKVGGSSGEFLGADGEYHDLETRLSGIESRLAALEGGGTA